MGVMRGDAGALKASRAGGAVRCGAPRRAKKIVALQQALDILFEAESAERAPPPIKRLFAMAQGRVLRLATREGRAVPPGGFSEAAARAYVAPPARYRAAAGAPRERRVTSG